MNGKSLILITGIALAAYFLYFRVETVEHDAYKSALAAAAHDDRLVLLFFTGSDWCGGCIAIEEETFSQVEYKKYARENLETVVVDFPRAKPQRAEIQAQNRLLSDAFHIEGYPTLILVNSQGREVARRSGTTIDSPRDFIAWVESVR